MTSSTLELESELEQDEHPRNYAAELEDEEEEAAPTSEKRLKREIRAEALRRLEEAARTESDFLTVVDEWNKLDRNRERRERILRCGPMAIRSARWRRSGGLSEMV